MLSMVSQAMAAGMWACVVGTRCSAVRCVCDDHDMWRVGLVAGCGWSLRAGVLVSVVSGGELFWCERKEGWDWGGQERGSEGGRPRRGTVVLAAPPEGGEAGTERGDTGESVTRCLQLAAESNLRGGVGGH